MPLSNITRGTAVSVSPTAPPCGWPTGTLDVLAKAVGNLLLSPRFQGAHRCNAEGLRHGLPFPASAKLLTLAIKAFSLGVEGSSAEYTGTATIVLA
jgi:hypothetical protein